MLLLERFLFLALFFRQIGSILQPQIIASAGFKVGSEPLDSCRILAIGHEDDFAPGKVGDDRDVVMPLLAGFIHADGGDFGIVLQRASLVS